MPDRAVYALLFLPILAPLLLVVNLINWSREPFGDVDLIDVAIFFGTPVVIVASLIVWLNFARRYRAAWPIVLPCAAWFVFLAYHSVRSFLLPYFDEPWNH